MTYRGGTGGLGVAFKISAGGTTYSVLANFPESSKGIIPNASLVQGSDGVYYGTTTEGGTYNHGTVFKLCNGSFSVIRSFNGNTNGSTPMGNLVQGSDGNFYGTTYQGGTYGKGTIFKITPGGSLTIIRHLNGSTDGANPEGSLVLGPDGSFYGQTTFGGTKTYGTIFKISASGTFNVLRQLDYNLDGGYPKGSLTLGTDGNFYGLNEYGGTNNHGTIFRISSGGAYTVLHHFNNPNGAHPQGSLIQATDGSFYGTTHSGGTTNGGTIFKINTGGTFTLLRKLNYTTDGGYPRGSLIKGTDGSFYGMTSEGGTNDDGTIFKMSTAGTITVLRHLNEETDGANPVGNLIIQKGNPVANAQSVTTTEDTPKAITLSGTGGSPLTYNIVVLPKNGTLSGSGANRTYTPKANFQGADSFTFTVSWGCQTSATKTVSITVNGVNDDAPVLAPIGPKTVAKGSPLSFTATATDPDAGQTKIFSLLNAPAGASIGASSGAFTWTPATGGTFTFTVKVTDNGSPALSDTEQITVTVTSGTSAPSTVRLNTGGPAVSVGLGSFSADAYSTGSTATYSNAVPIEGTTSDAIYQDYRRAATTGGSFGYNIPVTNGTYNVKLYFAEIAPSVTTTGQRVFNVSAEGAAWLTNYDIVAKAGGLKKAVSETKSVTVSDGNLTLNFTSVVERACVSAIQITPATTTTARLAEYPEDESNNFISGLYPNPATDKITVSLLYPAEKVATTITDASGNKLLKDKHHQVAADKLQLNIGTLKPGLYLLHVQNSLGSQTIKFIKQ